MCLLFIHDFVSSTVTHIFALLAGIHEICLAMDGSERSYRLLSIFEAGQQLHKLSLDQQHNSLQMLSPLTLKQKKYKDLKTTVSVS